jgi:hypothetical protein
VTVIASTLTTRRHLVRLTHGATKETIEAIRLGPVEWPRGWSSRIARGIVVVQGPETGAGPSHLDVIVTDAVLVPLLALPTPADDQPPDSVRVALGAEEIEVAVNPAALELIVTVHSATAPAGGLVVQVKAASGGTTVTLTEGAPGVYSASRVWGTGFINADLLVGGQSVRKVSLDYSRAKTRIHVVDPT